MSGTSGASSRTMRWISSLLASLGSSRNRASAFARCMCLGVPQAGSNSAGFATMTAAHRARDVATFKRFRLYRKSVPLGASSGCDTAIE